MSEATRLDRTETAFIKAYAQFVRTDWAMLTEEQADTKRDYCIQLFSEVKRLFSEARK